MNNPTQLAEESRDDKLTFDVPRQVGTSGRVVNFELLNIYNVTTWRGNGQAYWSRNGEETKNGQEMKTNPKMDRKWR